MSQQPQELITQHLDLWSSAIAAKTTSGRGSSKKIELYGVKKLRELILELAMRGKLVSQDPNDEPASAFLNELKAQRDLLVKEKKIRKPKKLPLLEETDKPHPVPSGWVWSRLGDLCEKLTDGSHNPPANAGAGFPMLSSQNVNFDRIDFDNPSRYVTEVDFERENERTSVEPGDVLLNIVASIGRSAVVPPNAPKFVLQRSVGVVKTRLVPRFLSKQFVAPVCLNYYERNAKGTAQKGIYLGKLSLMPIAVPPENEQHRIVAKVDELMALCDQLENQTEQSLDAHATLADTLLDALTQAQSHAELMENWQRLEQHWDILFPSTIAGIRAIDKLKQTILQLAVMGKLVPQDPNDEPASELLKRIAAEKEQLVKDKKIKKQKPLPPISDEEKPFELPEGWEWCRIGEFSKVGTGATPSRTNPDYWSPREINWVSSGETSQPFIEGTTEKISEKAVMETNVSVYPPGTLIVAMYGQGKTRGQVTELRVSAGTNQACAAIQFYEENSAYKAFVKLHFEKSYDEIRSSAAGGAQPNLNVGKIAAGVLPVPPLEEQKRIVAKVEELTTLCDQLKQRLQTAQQTQQHFTDAVVAGALGPQSKENRVGDD